MGIVRAKIKWYVLITVVTAVVFIIYEINQSKKAKTYSDLLKWINLNLRLINLNLTQINLTLT